MIMFNDFDIVVDLRCTTSELKRDRLVGLDTALVRGVNWKERLWSRLLIIVESMISSTEDHYNELSECRFSKIQFQSSF